MEIKGKLFEQDGKKYVRTGDKVLPVDRIENGVPVIMAQCETIKHEDGSQDVVVRVPCLNILGTAKE